MKRILLLLGAAVVVLLLLFPLPPGRFMVGGIHMPKHVLFFIFGLVMLISAVVIHAQGFTGPGSPPPPPGSSFGPPPPLGGPGFDLPPPPPGGPGFAPPPPPGRQGTQGQYGFTGPARTVAVEQIKTFAHRTPVIISGAIAQFIGADCYTFRDSSGEITLRIGPREWETFGSTINPSDNIEISGEVHRDELDPTRMPEVHARFIRKL